VHTNSDGQSYLTVAPRHSSPSALWWQIYIYIYIYIYISQAHTQNKMRGEYIECAHELSNTQLEREHYTCRARAHCTCRARAVPTRIHNNRHTEEQSAFGYEDIHTHIHTHNTHTRTHTHTHTHTHTYTHTRTHTLTQHRRCWRLPTNWSYGMLSLMWWGTEYRAHIHTHTHTRAHAHTYTHIHIYTHA